MDDPAETGGIILDIGGKMIDIKLVLIFLAGLVVGEVIVLLISHKWGK